MKVILASGSPRRRELMEMLGVACEVRPSGAEEVVTSAEPEKVVEELSRLKCLDVAEVNEGDSVVIGADTVVAFEGEILGKPKGIEHARKMMRELQGKGASGVYWSYDCGEDGDAKRVVTFCDCTDVEFYAMTDGGDERVSCSRERGGGSGVVG